MVKLSLKILYERRRRLSILIDLKSATAKVRFQWIFVVVFFLPRTIPYGNHKKEEEPFRSFSEGGWIASEDSAPRKEKERRFTPQQDFNNLTVSESKKVLSFL